MSDAQSRIARRSFLQLAGSAGLAAQLPGAWAAPQSGWSGYDDALVIDALGGLGNLNNPSARTLAERIDARALEDGRLSGVAAMNVTLPWVAGPGDPYTVSVQAISDYDALIAAHPARLLKVGTAADIERAKRDGLTGLIYGFQNAEQLGGDAGRVGEFRERGIRVIQLTYNIANSLGHGSLVPENGGLTEFGREALAEMNARRVLVDLSHSGEQTCLDALRHSTQPISITHTGCRALADLPRNKTDAELRLLAERGGVAGIYYMPFLNEVSQPWADAVVRHVEHALTICGEDHVGIGTDNPVTGIDDLPAYHERVRAEIAERRRMGISAPGEADDIIPAIPDLMGPDKYRLLADRLHRRGHPDRVIEKVLGGNFLRLMGDVWGG